MILVHTHTERCTYTHVFASTVPCYGECMDLENDVVRLYLGVYGMVGRGSEGVGVLWLRV